MVNVETNSTSVTSSWDPRVPALFMSGHPMIYSVPNRIDDYGSFYVSYNNIDYAIYGSDTTALVVGQMEKFYILDGDHRQAYKELAPKGLMACIDYFHKNSDKINKFSDKINHG